jgi:integrase/recombinase XerD
VTGLRQAAEEYLAIRRALGFQLVNQGRLLMEFVDYLEHAETTRLTTTMAVAWARQPAQADPSWWGQRLSVVRGFAQHLHAIDPTCEVPAADILPARFSRAVPRLYSHSDITQLMQAASALVPPLRAATYTTVIGLLATTGMRIGEVIRLDRDDVDWAAHLLVVHVGKNGKSCEVPLHPSTIDALQTYARQRDQLCPHPVPVSFFVSARGDRLFYRSVCSTFRRLVREAGIEAATRRPPRLHDLRHSFIVATLLDWYRSGVDVEVLMPRLSTYVGHAKPSATYWYLEAAPELLALAADRLEHTFEKRS